MDYKVKGISYGLLLSHTFPGLVLEVEVILAFQFFTNLDVTAFFLHLTDSLGTQSASRLVLIVIGMFIVATVLGVVIDGLHHVIYERFKKEDYEICKHIKTVQQMQIYMHFVEDDLWYYYEAYANTGIAMIPGFILLSYWLIWCLKPHWIFTAIILAIYLFLLIVTFIEVSETIKEVEETERSLIENFKSSSVSSKSDGGELSNDHSTNQQS